MMWTVWDVFLSTNYRLSRRLFFDEVDAAEPEGIQHSAEPTC